MTVTHDENICVIRHRGIVQREVLTRVQERGLSGRVDTSLSYFKDVSLCSPFTAAKTCTSLCTVEKRQVIVASESFDVNGCTVMREKGTVREPVALKREA